MPKRTRLVPLVLCLPLALGACSASSGGSAHRTPTASPTPPATLAVATAYVLHAREGVSQKDLRTAVTRLSSMPGVASASVTGKSTLRVDLTGVNIDEVSAQVIAELRKLGTVSVATA